jgi:hypothetical protein
MTEPPKPPTPRGLGTSGRRLWRAAVASYEFGPGELLLLEKAARTADDVDRIEAALVDAPLVTIGSAGQERAHPLLAELRAFRALLAQLVRQLGLEVDDEPVRGVALTPSQIGRKAAAARWGHRSPNTGVARG